MMAGSTFRTLLRRLRKLPPDLPVPRRRHYEVFLRVHLIVALCLLLLLLPLAAWLGAWQMLLCVPTGLALSLGALATHLRGAINASVSLLLVALMATTLVGMVTFGTLSGFDYYFALIILILYLSDFSSLTKALCSVGFLLSMSGVYLYMQLRGAPLSLAALELHPFVRVLNLTFVTLAGGAVLTNVERVARYLEHLYRNSAALDPLTEVLNRRGILAASERYHRQGWSYAVMVIDVDYFKAINDTYGHACGDEVLRHLVRCMRESLRDGDAVGRVGGEEFLILLREMPLDGAIFVAERLRARIERTSCVVNGVALKITVSVGIAVSGADLSLNAVIEQADRRLYQAKRRGRNRCMAHDAVEA